PVMPPVPLTTVVVVAVRTAVVHCVNRFPTFSEPSPVARSYFKLDIKAGVPLSAKLHVTPPLGVVEGEQIITPYPPDFVLVLLQFGVPASQATELFPLVTSLKTQAGFGVCPSEEAQFPP